MIVGGGKGEVQENGVRNENVIAASSTVGVCGLPPLPVPASISDYLDVVVAYPISIRNVSF